MDADGSDPTNLTNDPGRDTAPAWAPGGAAIAFRAFRGIDAGGEIFVMNADGSAQTNLTNDPGTMRRRRGPRTR